MQLFTFIYYKRINITNKLFTFIYIYFDLLLNTNTLVLLIKLTVKINKTHVWSSVLAMTTDISCAITKD